ncbi:hypothetical protein ABZ837_14225 [Streptomyces sp. NPDC047197]|uniref:hypothetical protein n=1 Tax=Streptomyces sp. NPDC047197 TaxID=3155477 RepID=UPI0033D2B0C3
MGTTPMPAFRRLFVVLLGGAMAVAFAVSAALDALALRRQHHRIHRLPPVSEEPAPFGRPARTLVHH